MFDNCLTNEIKLTAGKQKLTTEAMKIVTMTVRNFIRNYKKICEKKQTVIVENRGKPVWTHVPYEEWANSQEKKKTKTKFNMKELEKYMFKGGDPNMSRDIDKILYKNWKS